MPDHEIFKEHDPEDCFYDCKAVHDFMRLTDEMVHTIIGLEEELVRWRQALVYDTLNLPKKSVRIP